MKRWLVAVLVAVVAAFVVRHFVLAELELHEGVAPPPARESSAPPSPPASLDAPRPVDTSRAPSPPAVAEPTRPPEVVAPAADPAARRRVRGFVVVEDGGVELTSESGTLTLVLWTNRRGNGTAVEVRAGRFECDVGDATHWSIEGGRLRERAVVPTPECSKKAALDDTLTVRPRVRWPPVTTLVARDARTNEHVRGLEVVVLPESGIGASRASVTTGRANAVQLRGDSPLTISYDDVAKIPFAQVLHVRAPGYAWSMAHVTPASGGEVFVELEPGGDLDVRIVGGDPNRREWLRLRASGGDVPILEQPRGREETVRLESLPAGRHTLSAELGEWFANPDILARADVEIVAGTRVAVTLEAKEPVRPETFAVSGRVVVPKAWGSDLPTMRMTPLDERGLAQRTPVPLTVVPASSDDGASTFTWSTPAAAPGHYAVRVDLVPFTVVVDVPTGGRSDVVVEVPPPADVEVRVLDALTGADVDVRHVQWTAGEPRSVPLDASTVVRRNAQPPHYAFRAPIGEAEVSCVAFEAGYGWTKQRVTIRPGRNVVTLELERACGVEVSVRDGEKLLHCEGSSDLEIVPVGGEGRVRGSRTQGDVLTLFVSTPGRYRIGLKRPMPGYEMPPATEVDVPTGTVVPVAIPLRRKP